MRTNLLIAAITAYCHCAKCCGDEGNPTASGVMPEAGVTIAAPRWVPFGSLVHIEGIGWRRVQDRLARRYDNRWDVFMKSHGQARRFGIRSATVTVIIASNQ